MKRALYHVVVLVFLGVFTTAAAENAYPVVDPGKASMEITDLLADAKPDDAVEAIKEKLPSAPSMQFNLEQLRNALRLLTKNGGADVKDVISVKTYGSSVHIELHYLHLPVQEIPANQFVFLRYTYMKGSNGWTMTAFDFKTSGAFPPQGWNY